MPSPFPGMNPYFEDSDLWPSVHHSLADALIGQLNPRIGPKYYADVETRTVIEDIAITLPSMRPDAGIFHQLDVEFLPARGGDARVVAPEAPLKRVALVEDRVKLHVVQLYVTETNQLVTSIEILSPYNKRQGEGLDQYRQKRKNILHSAVHFIELDLLRGGQRPGLEVSEPPLDTDYVLLVNRYRPEAARISEIWTVAISEPLPLLPVPLLAPDPDVVMDLNSALRAVHERAGYEWRLDYRKPLPPPDPRPSIAEWWKGRLAQISQPK